jgi:hypothetical protein
MSISALYLVKGSCGSYDDRREWMVAAYLDPAQAEEHRRLAAEAAKAMAQQYPNQYWLAAPTRYDPNCALDCGHAHYAVVPVPFITGPAAAVDLQGVSIDWLQYSQEQKKQAPQLPAPGSFAAKLGAVLGTPTVS